MTGSADRSAESPRVFISYARADGEDFARKLREDLEAAGILCWMDRYGLEGGKDWRQQILEALDTVEFLVLVMSPAAIQSSGKSCGCLLETAFRVRRQWHAMSRHEFKEPESNGWVGFELCRRS